jgi:hypothetical protein
MMFFNCTIGMQIFLPAFLEQIEKDRGQPTTGLVFLDGTSKYFIPTNGCLLSGVCEVMGVCSMTIYTITQKQIGLAEKPLDGTSKYFIPTNGCLLSGVCEVMGVCSMTIYTITQKQIGLAEKPFIARK